MLITSFNLSKSKEQGFAHLLLLVIVIVVIVAIVLLLNVRVTDHPSAKVQGVFIAEGGDSGSGGSGSFGGDSSSGSSGGSGGGDSQTSGFSNTGSSGSGDSGFSSQTSDESSSGESQNPSSQKTETGLGGSPSSNTETDHHGSSKVKLQILVASSSSEINGEDNQNISESKSAIEVEKAVESEVESDAVQNVQVTTKDGELEIETITASISGNLSNEKEASLSGHHRGKTNKLILAVKDTNGQDKVEIEGSGDETKITDKGVSATTTFPLSINPVTKQLEVTTPAGIKPIRILPDQVSQVAETAEVQNNIEKIELVSNSIPNTTDSAAFQVNGEKTGTLFGFIPVSVSVNSQVGAQSGELLEVNEPLWVKLFSSFIK